MTADIVTKIKLEFAQLGQRWSTVELEGMSLAALLYHALVEDHRSKGSGCAGDILPANPA